MKHNEHPAALPFWKRWVLRCFKLHPHNIPGCIRWTQTWLDLGLVSNDTGTMLEGVLQLGLLRVQDIMIPRSQAVVVHQDASPEGLLEMMADVSHSRFPVVGDSHEDVAGVLLAKDLLTAFIKNKAGEPLILNQIMRPAFVVPENKRLDVLLHECRRNRQHMAIAVNEYGAMTGLVTIEDILEQIVGDILDEHDEAPEAPIRSLDDHTHMVKALISLDTFNDYFEADLDDTQADTLSGFLIHHVGRLPELHEVIELDDFRFEVVRSDNRRLDLLRVQHTLR